MLEVLEQVPMSAFLHAPEPVAVLDVTLTERPAAMPGTQPRSGTDAGAYRPDTRPSSRPRRPVDVHLRSDVLPDGP